MNVLLCLRILELPSHAGKVFCHRHGIYSAVQRCRPSRWDADLFMALSLYGKFQRSKAPVKCFAQGDDGRKQVRRR